MKVLLAFLALFVAAAGVYWLRHREPERADSDSPKGDEGSFLESPEVADSRKRAEVALKEYYFTLLEKAQWLTQIAQQEHDERRAQLIELAAGNNELEESIARSQRLVFLGVDVIHVEPTWADVQEVEEYIKRMERRYMPNKALDPTRISRPAIGRILED